MKSARIGLYASIVMGLSTNWAGAISLNDITGKWTSINSDEVIIFQNDGDVIDYRLGQGRFSNNVIQYGANVVVVYQGNKSCWYFASVTPDGGVLTLARRDPNQDPWQCTSGQFIPAK